MTDDVRPDPDQPEAKPHESARPELEGPAADALAAEEAVKAAASDTFEQAIDGLFESQRLVHDKAPESACEPGATPKLERLQKILAQAGIASRRHAEELITQGRVQVNGKVVTELGTKANAARDHIRVDGKLLQGSERLRYFMLNKPKGFVTTVNDPEGRPTIMQFFSKMRERLYPVGRLDYLSEGLLLMTNDGELANKLTRAASGVEKTYLVKVSGHPSEEDIDRLREGVGIDRGQPGAGRVQTAPAQIRKVRHGDNPWYEVVLIEGRNRELRKMFEEIGHHVEKIRRVGYGPLVLDLEPGKIRELEAEEVDNLRKAAEGKYRKPKVRESRKAGARPEFRPPGPKPNWKQKGGEIREEHRDYRRPERPDRRAESGRSRRPERGDFSARPRGEFGSKPRFEEPRPQHPPRRESSDRPGARPDQVPGSGRSRDFGRSPKRRQLRPERRGEFHPEPRHTPRFAEDRPPQSPRREDRDRAFGSKPEKREGFAGERSSRSGAGPKRLGGRPPRGEFRGREESRAEQPARRRFEPRSGTRPFRQSREDQPPLDRPRREEGRVGKDESRSSRPDKRQPGPRSGGFKQGKRGGYASNQGSVRSGGGGRRPGSKPGPKSGGKRRPSP